MSLLVRPKTKTSALPEVQTGNREWTYEVVRGWGSLPSSTSFGLLGWFFSDRLWNLLRSSIGKLLRSPTFQLSLDVRNGFTSPADAGTAVNQRGPFPFADTLSKPSSAARRKELDAGSCELECV